MLNSRLKELAQYKAKIANIEKAIASERQVRLRGLHTELGFESRDELLQALRALGGRGRKGRGRPSKGRASGGKRRRKRTTITKELRAKIVAAAKDGGTGMAIAKQFGVSLPTVQNIKRAAGLTRKRKRSRS